MNSLSTRFLLSSLAAIATTVIVPTIAIEPSHSHDSHSHDAHSDPSHGHDSHSHDSHSHGHPPVTVPDGAAVPNISAELTPDPMGGWNLHVTTENFEFDPASVNQDSDFNAGHAHIYLNGEKLTRLYSHWYYIDDLPAGDHTLTVTLNTNLHEDLFHQGQRIETSIAVEVPE